MQAEEIIGMADMKVEGDYWQEIDQVWKGRLQKYET